MSSVYSCPAFTNTQDAESQFVVLLCCAFPSNFDLAMDEVVGHHVEAQRKRLPMQLGWDARIMTGDERFFFGIVKRIELILRES